MIIDVTSTKTFTIGLGRQGENKITRIVFDFSGFVQEYGEGNLSCVVQRRKGDVPYLATMTTDGHMATWLVTNTDTAYAGTGKVQLSFIAGDQIKKSVIYKTKVEQSIVMDGDDPSVTSITATFTQGDNVIYESNTLDSLRQYLVVTANYSTGDSFVVSGYTLSGTLTSGTSTITVTFGENTDTFDADVTAVAVESLSATYTPGTHVVYAGDTLESLKPYIAVTALYNDGTSTVISEYALSGTLVAGNNTITVSYSGASTTITVEAVASAVTLTGISAAFTQGTAAIYDTDSLETLKQYLVVTAFYSDGTSEAVSGYTLSGTLTAGTSTITVSYEDFTDEFTVAVTAKAMTSITAAFTQGEAVIYDSDELDSLKQYLVVTANYNDGSTVAVPSADYTLSGTLTPGTSTITVSYEGQTDTFVVTVTAEHTSATISFYNGSTLITTATVLDGGDATYSGTTPTKAQDAQYTYTFAGWSKDDDNTVDADALTAVTADRNVYACFAGTARTYTVYFYNGSTLLETDTGVPYGGSATYNGSTPVNPDDSSLGFLGWSPQPTNITGNTSCYAQFEQTVQVAEITDSWDTIIANIDNGTYSSVYKVGNYKPLDLGTEGIINMQIVAMDADELASGGTAPLTFIGMELLNTTHRMNATQTASGGWFSTELRSYLEDTILSGIPSNISTRINSVKKYSSVYEDGALVKDGQVTYDKLWIPGAFEVFGDTSSGTTYEDNGATYDTIYNNSTSRIKYIGDSATQWLLRSSSTNVQFRSVTTSGGGANAKANSSYGVCLGFCLGLEPEE